MNESTTNRLPHEPGEAWLPYEPGARDPWDLARVLRMHRRAGFGATWAEAQRDLADGYEPAITRLLEGAPTGANGRPAAAIETFCDAMFETFRDGGGELDAVGQSWLYRMVVGAWPLRERMVLAWHTHYATSNVKVRDKGAISRQMCTQRNLWRSEIGALHLAMLRDNAMLYWLDGAQNRRSAPNENLARELLELFALGVGNYTEHDIREAARSLTGWQRISERQQQLKYQDVLHDAGPKTIFGETGNWNEVDLVRLIDAQPAAARRIAWRLWRTFVSDVDEPSPPLLEGLAASMRVNGEVYVQRGLETLLRSRLFQSTAFAERRVMGPVEWVSTVLRGGELFPPHPDLAEVVAVTGHMGQTLFQPPNVAGWPGGKAWLTGPALVARQNFVAWLTSPDSGVPAEHWDSLPRPYSSWPRRSRPRISTPHCSGDAHRNLASARGWTRSLRPRTRTMQQPWSKFCSALVPLISRRKGQSHAIATVVLESSWHCGYELHERGIACASLVGPNRRGGRARE